MLQLPGHLYRWDRQKLNHATEQTQTSCYKGWPQQQHRRTPLKNKPTNDWDSAICLTYSTDYYQRITLESWFTNSEQTALNRLSTSSRTIQTFTQQETVTHCLWFILQRICLHSLSPHTSSQSTTSRIYQRLLYLLTNQIAHQGF